MEYIITIGIVLLITFFIINIFSSGADQAQLKLTDIGEVAAGNKDDHIDNTCSCDEVCDDLTMNSYLKLKDSVFMHRNRFIDKNHIIKKVKGGCMQPYGIRNGEYIMIELFDKKIEAKNKLKAIKEGDILYIIYYDDKNNPTHKIRVYEGTYNEQDRSLNTYYFDNGEVSRSSMPHSLDKIKGIVRYKVPF